MKRKTIWETIAASKPLMVVGALAMLALPITAQSNDGPCSNRTIRGEFGFKVDGQLVNGPVTGLLRGLSMSTFDGYGNMTQLDTATINGIPRWPGWRYSTGVYSINPDCTGTAEIHPTDGSPVLKLMLVVVQNGREIHTVVLGNPTGSVGIKRD